jgi:ABC-type proline/glycine betaine transport system permease subunit
MRPIPLKLWIAEGLDGLHHHLGFLFNAFSGAMASLDGALGSALGGLPPYVLILLIALVLAWRRGVLTALSIAAGLLVVWNIGLWSDATETISLVLIATGISCLLGIPLGILLAESPLAARIVTPVLDYMQTTPAFVYLIPSVLFFGIGTAPGVFATVMFALPPLARNVALGIREVDADTIEAAEAFGATWRQLLAKVKLPLALPYFVVGINQCIMMSLSMVVMASLIGARGLGTIVVTSLAQVDFPKGIESGLAVVAIAIALDRLSRPMAAGSRLRALIRLRLSKSRGA